MAENGNVNLVLGKALSVLPETELSEPVRNLLHRRPSTDFNAIRSGPACRGVYLKAMLSRRTVPGLTGTLSGFSISSLTNEILSFQTLRRYSLMNSTVMYSP